MIEGIYYVWQASDVSSSSSLPAAQRQPGVLHTSPGGVRRKRITRRIGYGRDDAAGDDHAAGAPMPTTRATAGMHIMHQLPAPHMLQDKLHGQILRSACLLQPLRVANGWHIASPE